MENAALLQDWLIHRFIARPDCYAIQGADGKWFTARESGTVPYAERPLIPWGRDVLEAHLDGHLTTGHYMLSTTSTAKLMAFDIDFSASGFCPANYDNKGGVTAYEMLDLREEWRNRGSFHRPWLKHHLRKIAHIIASCIHYELEIPVAVAYSGNKGIHVYGFTGEMAASEIRLAAEMVMKAINVEYGDRGTNFELSRGSFEWTDTNNQLDHSFANLTIEVFPKQDEVGTDSFGNLMAMPLGVNRKSPEDPKFFIDLRAPLTELVPVDPIWALSTTNPWEN